MGWEKRGEREYFYRKVRIGGRVRSEYIGTGETATLIAKYAAILREQRGLEAWEHNRQRAEQAEIDGQIAELQEIVSLLTKAVLLTEGYHTHKRQWRRRREQQEPSRQEGRQ